MTLHPSISRFIPHPLLKNPHVMTLFPRYWPRSHKLWQDSYENRLFQVDHESHILAVCNWQADRIRHPVLLLVHGLEGCSESHYMKGIARKAWHAGFNVIRMNQRNCGGTEHLTPGLYDNGLSQDVRAVIVELASREGFESVWAAGYSMGGNIVLRMAGEAGEELYILKGVVAVCPNIHPAACVEALEQPRNLIYHNYFLASLKSRLRRKAHHFPGRFDLSLLPKIKTMSGFDDAYTAPFAGYHNAADYYEKTGARHILDRIRIPTLLITSQDDPFIPFTTFDIAALHSNPAIGLIAPRHGGHCGFIQRPQTHEDMFWAENRVVEFIQNPRMAREI